jgi:hypothetical protein
MIISREKRTYPFKNHFNLESAQERQFLGWVLNQFLYGEVTGIQCGYWLYHAPTLKAAAFLSRQATEEISHVKRILMIMNKIQESPTSAHRMVRFLSTSMMGQHWGEHVAMEMAIGESLVLQAFYALADTIPDVEIKKIIESAIIDEEKHVNFGETETLEWLKKYPHDRELLLGLAWIQYRALKALKSYIVKNKNATLNTIPVLQEFDSFFEHTLTIFNQQLMALGLTQTPIHQLSTFTIVRLLTQVAVKKSFSWIRSWLPQKDTLLTTTYLSDPMITTPLSTSKEQDSVGLH